LNPYNNSYYPGGSSSATAWSIATGLVPFALGADAGGSIRIPASFNGLYGIKPSHGRIGETELTMCVIGPLAATIGDLEVAFRVMAKPDEEHPVQTLFLPPRPHRGPRHKVLGICDAWFARADAPVQAACRKAIDHLVATEGYTVINIDIPYLYEGQLAHATTTMAEMNKALKQLFPSHPNHPYLQDLTAPLRTLSKVFEKATTHDYFLAQQLRNLLMEHLAWLWQQHSGMVILTPTSPVAGWPIRDPVELKHGVMEGNMTIKNMEFIWLANFVGAPAITAPVGYVEPEIGEGMLPVGLMALGHWGSEDELFEFGREVESYLNNTYEGGRRTPKNWVNPTGLAKAKASA
jgi:Asp-tRNA(Asn)/Glu-tRNA(Gln) amidotransferase A subunit family amidase